MYKHVAVLCARHPALTQPRPQSSGGLPGPASWSAQPWGNRGAVRRTLQEMCLSSTLSLVPPPPSTADSSHPSIGLTCFHGNWNPGLQQPLVLPPVITSSLKCKASSPGALGCAERSFTGRSKERGQEKRETQPQAGHTDRPGWRRKLWRLGEGREGV